MFYAGGIGHVIVGGFFHYFFTCFDFYLQFDI